MTDLVVSQQVIHFHLTEAVRQTIAFSLPQTTLRLACVGPVGPKGDTGERGPAGDTPILTGIAGMPLGGHRAIVFNTDGTFIYADQSIPDHAERVLGITTGAAEAGAEVTIQTGGELTEPSWTWVLDQPIYLGTNGLLTQAVPTTGFIQQLAIPLSATSIKFISQTAFFLE